MRKRGREGQESEGTGVHQRGGSSVRFQEESLVSPADTVMNPPQEGSGPSPSPESVPPAGSEDFWSQKAGGSSYCERDWKTFFQDFKDLGKGSYGKVFAATSKTGKKVAIKEVPNVFESRIQALRLLREIRILRYLQKEVSTTPHQCIVDFLGLLKPSNMKTFTTLRMVLEHVAVDLNKIIHSDQFFTAHHVKYFLYQILLGVHHMHVNHIIHRDLKPANILVNANCSLKICDFGLSRSVEPLASPEKAPARRLSKPREGGSTDQMIDEPPRSHPPLHRSLSIDLGHEEKANNRGNEDQDFHSASSDVSMEPLADQEALQPMPRMARHMTEHVVTRYYRAPELILVPRMKFEANYSYSIDIWSIGCIFAELLSMQKESFASSQSRKVLFPGRTCYPLSGGKGNKGSAAEQMDQLEVILRVVGFPSVEEVAHVLASSGSLEADDQGTGSPDKTVNGRAREAATEFVRELESRQAEKEAEEKELQARQKAILGDSYLGDSASSSKSKGRKDFAQMFKGAGPDAIELLEGMLQFDPSKRMTALNALHHPYLDQVRDTHCPPKEGSHQKKGRNPNFNFEDSKQSYETLREMIVEQIDACTYGPKH